MPFVFEKFDTESKIDIEKLIICGYNYIEKFHGVIDFAKAKNRRPN